MYNLNGECLQIRIKPPAVMLDAVSGLLRFYPWVLRLGLVLQRLVQ